MADGDKALSIEQLLAAGQLEQAARQLEQAGRSLEAVVFYERLWDFSAAARAARTAGDTPRALRNILRGNDRQALEEMVQRLAGADATVQQSCATLCEERGEAGYAALFRERAGQLEAAANLYEQAGLFARAARLCEQRGDVRRAMSLYQRQLEHDAQSSETDAVAEDDDTHTRFELGRLLLRHGRYAQAIPLLQPLWRGRTSLQRDAGIACAAALQRAGYAHAARATAAALQRDFPEVASVDFCLRDERFQPVESDEEHVVLGGRYRMGELVGSGGMSRVYQAHDLIQDRPVAIKVFSTPGGTRGLDARRRFMREALITGQLDHPHIVPCYDFSADGFMVLEYMAGGSLAARVAPPLSVAACRAIALQVISGLAAAHQRGIIHRDVKPSNIFFSAAGAAKLGDFGIAHLQDHRQTQTGAFLGTLAFMAPEQIRGADITFATDIYALGVTLYVMLTGSPPYEPPNMLDKHLHAAIPEPSARRPSIPLICDAVIVRCLQKNAADRFGSLDALRREIEKFPAGVVLQGTAPAEQLEAADETPAEAAGEAGQSVSSGKQRYAVEGRPRRCGCLQTVTAWDSHLTRPVVLIELPAPDRQPLLWRVLHAAAARGDEHLQRVLALDTDAGRAILAAEGETARGPGRSSEVDRLVFCEQLALAVVPLHAAGVAHGAIAAEAVRQTDTGCELSLVTALAQHALRQESSTAPPSLADDIAAIVRLATLTPPNDLADAAALAAWAADEQTRLREEQRQRRHGAALDKALDDAPEEQREALILRRADAES